MRTNLTNLAKRSWLFVRAHQWWQYKVPLALAAAFAFSWMNRTPFSRLLLPTGLLLSALVSMGIWASVINDFTDLDQDRRAGKSTPMMGLSPAARRASVAASLALNAAVALLLHRHPLSLLLLAAAWATFAVYSIPPIRLKERGALGLLCIALGEHALPGLLAVSLVLETTGTPVASVPAGWLCAYLGWSAAYGLRGIIWHQLDELEGDRRGGVRTVGTEIGAARLTHIGERWVFPAEALFLLLLMILSRDGLGLALLPAYALTEWLRCRYMGLEIVVAAPKPKPRFLLLEYYQIYLPLSFLGMALPSDRSALFLFAAYLLLFPSAVALLADHLGHMFRWRVYERIRAALANC